MKADPNHWNEKELKRVVTHELGHSLGLLHEQSFPGVVKWNKSDSVYNYYRETQGWDREKLTLMYLKSAISSIPMEQNMIPNPSCTMQLHLGKQQTAIH